MIAADVIEAIVKCGGELVIKNGGVRLRQPQVVPAALRATARDRKAEIEALLQAMTAAPPIECVAFWKAAYDDIETWTTAMQSAFVKRADAIEADGEAPDAAEAQAYLDLREAARAPSPAAFLRARSKMPIESFTAISRRCIGRVAPSTTEEDARVAVALLRRHARVPR